MIPLLTLHALAAPCDGADAFPLTLLQRVEGLQFEDDGTLFVVDRGSLTRRDPATLRLVDDLAPGLTGWSELRDDGTAASTDLVWTPGGLVRGHARKPSTVGLARRDVLPEPAWGTGYLPPAVRMSVHRAEPVTATAWAEDPRSGRVAVATPRWLRVFAASGELLAEQPVLEGVDSMGVFGEGLFTVADGTAFLWELDGTLRETLEGRWFAGTVVGDELVLGDTNGRLHHLGPDGWREGLCVLGTCSPQEPPGVPRPLEGESEAAYRGAIKGWVDDLKRWNATHGLGRLSTGALAWRPYSLHTVGEHVVVAELDRERWHATGEHAVLALHQLDASATEVVHTVELAEPTTAPIEVHGRRLFLGQRAFEVPGLDVAAPLHDDGPALRITRGKLTDHVLVGGWDGGSFVGGGLPARGAPQRRSWTFGTAVDGGFLVASHRGPGHGGPVQLVCPVTPEVVPQLPGLLAEMQFGVVGDTAKAPKTTRRPAEDRYLRPGGGTVLPGAPRDGLIWTQKHLEEVPLHLVRTGMPALVVSEHPAPGELPEGVRWWTSFSGKTDGVAWIVDGVVVWRGHPSQVPDTLPWASTRSATASARVPESIEHLGPALDAVMHGLSLEEVVAATRRLEALAPDDTRLKRAKLWGQPAPALGRFEPPDVYGVVLRPREEREVWELADVVEAPFVAVDPAFEPRAGTPTATGWGTELPREYVLWIEEGAVRWAGPLHLAKRVLPELRQ